MDDTAVEARSAALRLRPNHVEKVSLQALADQFSLRGEPGKGTISGVSLDSRSVLPGDLYVASAGARVHGASFARDAMSAGASAVLTDEAGAELLQGLSLPVLVSADLRADAGRVSAAVFEHDELRCFAVTGTNGKTTVSYLVRSLLQALGTSTGLMGTVETVVGSTHIASELTTPESPVTHAALARMREAGNSAAVMEVSSHALTLGRVKGARFIVSGFTNLSQDHLDLHGDMEGYLKAKAQLFTDEYSATAVITVDDEYGVRMFAECGVPAISLQTTVTAAESTAGFKPQWRVSAVQAEGLGHRVTLSGPEGRQLRFTSSLPGDFNVSNAALAALMVHASGVSIEQLQTVFETRSPFEVAVPGRMQIIGTRPAAIVDFAHNPDGLIKALGAATPPRGKLITVMGATGDRDTTKRSLMGQIVADGSSVVIVTDDDPHGEDPARIRQSVLAGAHGRGAAVEEVSPRSAAIARAVELAGPEDTILVAGRGHETLQDVAGVAIALDDRVELAQALLAAGYELAPDAMSYASLTNTQFGAGSEPAIES